MGRKWGIIVVAVTFAGTALAQTKTQTLRPDEQVIELRLPEFNGRPQTHTFRYTSDYRQSVYHAGVSAVGGWPRFMVQVWDVQPGYKNTAGGEMNAGWIASINPWMKDKALNIYSAAPAGTQEAERIIRFTAANADCVGWSLFEGGRESFTAKVLPGRQVRGIYCGTPGQKLSADDIQRVRSGYRIKR